MKWVKCKTLWLVCDSMPLSFNGDDPLDFLGLIPCGSHSPRLSKNPSTSLVVDVTSQVCSLWAF